MGFNVSQKFSCLIVEMSFYYFISNNDPSHPLGGLRVILWEEIQPFVMYFRMFDPEKRAKIYYYWSFMVCPLV